MDQQSYEDWFQSWILDLKHRRILDWRELKDLREYIKALKDQRIKETKKLKEKLRKVQDKKNDQISKLKDEASATKALQTEVKQLKEKIDRVGAEMELLTRDNSRLSKTNLEVYASKKRLEEDLKKAKEVEDFYLNAQTQFEDMKRENDKEWREKFAAYKKEQDDKWTRQRGFVDRLQYNNDNLSRRYNDLSRNFDQIKKENGSLRSERKQIETKYIERVSELQNQLNDLNGRTVWKRIWDWVKPRL